MKPALSTQKLREQIISCRNDAGVPFQVRALSCILNGLAAGRINTLGNRAILEEEFRVPQTQWKSLVLQSRSFWESFFRERMTGPHKFGLGRAWGKKFIMCWGDWPDEEAEAFLETFGEWESSPRNILLFFPHENTPSHIEKGAP